MAEYTILDGPLAGLVVDLDARPGELVDVEVTDVGQAAEDHRPHPYRVESAGLRHLAPSGLCA